MAAAASQIMMARRGFLSKHKSMKHNAKTFIVAMDGSSTAKNGLFLALALRNPDHLDTIKVVTIGGDVGSMSNDLQAIGGSLGQQIKIEQLQLVDNVQKTLRIACEGHKHPVLIMGAAGKNNEDSARSAGARPKGQAPMGGVASECMVQVPCPVIFVKNEGWDCVRQAAANNVTELRARMMGRSPENPMSCRPAVIVCCVDGSPVSSKGVDITLEMAKRSDTVYILHVQNTDKDAAGRPRHLHPSAIHGTKEIELHYNERAQKSRDLNGLNVTYKSIHKGKKSIQQAIVEFVDHDDILADLLVLGSTELSNEETPGTFGSVTASTTKNVRCSVMVLKEAFYR